jgi:predicted amidohydrolase
MKIYCCQFDIAWENKPASHERARALLRGTRIKPGSLVLLPEMFATGFSMNVEAIREGHTRESERFLAELARELGACVIGGVVTTGADGRGRNQAVAFSPEGRELARYTKMQPFNLGGEGQHYAAGGGVVTFEWQGCTVAPFVCYDLRFPELFRAAVRRGAQVFAVIANWPVMRIGHWVTLLQARAIENLAGVAGVNRVGDDPKLKYNGRSLIVGPRGDVLADAGETARVIGADLDLADLEQWRADFPALRDMRADV